MKTPSDDLRAAVKPVLEEMDAYVLDEDRCGSDEEEYDNLSATLLPRWCDRIRAALHGPPMCHCGHEQANHCGPGAPATACLECSCGQFLLKRK